MIITSLLSANKEEIVISRKLGIVGKNYDEEISCYIKETIYDEIRHQKYISDKYSDRKEIRKFNINEIFRRDYFLLPSGDNIDNKIFTRDMTEELIIKVLSSNLIYIFIDEDKKSFLRYKNKYIYNPTCEPYFEDKFIGLYNFLEHFINDGTNNKSNSIDIAFCDNSVSYKNSRIITSLDWKSKKSGDSNYIFDDFGEEFRYKMCGLKYFGELVDSYLESKNDFYALDYIVDVLHHKENYGAFPIVKLFSIIELAIVNSKNYLHSELKKKLLRFIPDTIAKTEEEKCKWVSLIYRIRNKIAHGDFEEINKEINSYMEEFMGKWRLDLYEFSKLNWGYTGVVSDLYIVVSRVIWTMLTSKDEVIKLKNS